jgi:hypothetical protein
MDFCGRKIAIEKIWLITVIFISAFKLGKIFTNYFLFGSYILKYLSKRFNMHFAIVLSNIQQKDIVVF